ncbi:MAG: AMP-dependent synthetase/ligase [Pirellulales bacterium]
MDSSSTDNRSTQRPGTENMPSHAGDRSPRHVADWLIARLEQTPDRVAYWNRTETGYVPWTWSEVIDRACRCAALLHAWGVQPGDRVAQLSENRTEWLILDLATHIVRAVHVPIHASLTATQVDYQIGHSGSKVVCCSTPEQLQKVLSQPAGAAVQHVVLYAGLAEGVDARVVDWPTAIEQADAGHGQALLEQTLARAEPADLATILYTSGTTGEPKGVMLNQQNLVTNADGTQLLFGFQPDDVRLTFLPLSHIFARTCDLYTWLARGSQLALAGARETVLDDARAIRPMVMNGVPYFFEVVRRKFLESDYANQPDGLRAMLGGRLRMFCSGGAGLPEYLYDFFRDHGIPIYQGYGLTESSPVITISTPQADRRGASGQVLPGVDVRLGEDAEILARGPNIMQGYWQSPDATKQMVRDGWLYTGDYGSIDEDGFVYITGRKKELIVTSIGKNIAPVQLEALIGEDPLVHQVMIVGDNRNYLTALIVPTADPLRAQIISRQIAVTSKEEALVHPQVVGIYQELVDRQLSQLAPHEQVRKVALVGRPFTIEQGELTPKMSLRRAVILENFADVIERLYR